MANASQEKINKIDKAIVALYGDGKPSEENLIKIKVLAEEKNKLKIPTSTQKGQKKTFETDETGQNIINLDRPSDAFALPRQAGLKASSSILRGVSSLPFDAYAYTGLPGSKGSAQAAEFIRKTIPVVRGGVLVKGDSRCCVGQV